MSTNCFYFLAIAFGVANLISTLWLRVILSSYAELLEEVVITSAGEQTLLLNSSTTATRGESVDISGSSFLSDPSAWLLWTAFFCLSGTDLMVINSIGTMITALTLVPHLATLNSLSISPGRQSEFQTLHVSLIFIASCLGRITTGLVSDYYKRYHRIPRIIFWISAAVIMLSCQLYGAFGLSSLKEDRALANLWIISVGTSFSWDMRRFGLNWGIMGWAAGFGGLFFNLVFGWVFDWHAKRQNSLVNQREFGGYIGSEIKSLQFHGIECFQGAFLVTSAMCAVSIILRWVLIIRNRRALMTN
ncbi:hypothetical protein G9A89_005988 [Geosiphon pyriformis]|nr:hypothetical protein G9A89_005988 [Geosiphon pyriformis]